MNAQKTIRIFTAAALTALTMSAMTSVCHAESLAPAKQVRTAESSAAKPMSVSLTLPATVLIGKAMLEEYHGGNPADRTMVYRDTTVAGGKSH